MCQFTGVVQWFNNAKGFGFLKQDAGGADICVHYSLIVEDEPKSLKVGDAVEFDVIPGEKGRLQADIQFVWERCSL